MAASASGRPVLQLRVAITTADLDRLMKFYGDALGLQTAAAWSNDGGHAVLFDLGTASLELFDEAQAQAIDNLEAGRRVSGQIRLALQVPDLKAAMDRLLAHGATLIHPPVSTPWGDQNVRFQDPDGLQVTLFQPSPVKDSAK